MASNEDERLAREARQLRLPIISFDKRFTRMLEDQGVEAEDDSDGHLAQQQTAHAVTLWEYMTSIGLIEYEEPA